MAFNPEPIDTSAIQLGADIHELTEKLARNTHDLWAKKRIADGWRFGPQRDDAGQLHPCLVPYEQLPESEKEYDRALALETLKVMVALGYRVEKG